MSSTVTSYLNLPYVVNSTAAGHTLDLYEPASVGEKCSKLPLVVYIHGGGWTERDKKGTHLPNPFVLQSRVIFAPILSQTSELS